MLGPLLAFIVIGAVATFLWALFAPQAARPRPPSKVLDTPPVDYGLLCVAAITDDPQVAARVRSRLGDAGIRATIAPGPDDDQVLVLVFEGELDRARRVVGRGPA
ncbi:MAG: hypothetical protein FWJ93_10070 [Micromonosporaceae bacterium]